MLSEWSSSIGQADVADWVTVAAYLFAAITSVRAAHYALLQCQECDMLFWRITAVLLILLGINEVLDAQTLLTSLGRAYVKANGWYGGHRWLQYGFVIALGVAAVFGGIVMLWLTRNSHVSVRLALVGLGFIGLFILLRAASIHHLDDLLRSGAPEFSWGSLQEMAGILLVAGAAALYSRTRFPL